LRQLAGSGKPALLDPLRMYAYLPKVLNAYGRLEQAQSTLEKVLSARHRALAELKAATTVRCEYCIDLGSAIARRWGITDEELLALADYQNAVCFSDVDKLVLDYATAVSRTPVNVSEQLFDDLRAHFDEAALVAMTQIVALENMRARFNLALGIASSGVSGVQVCALPDTD
jgi:4-carboxymuconolactone decarboxylase